MNAFLPGVQSFTAASSEKWQLNASSKILIIENERPAGSADLDSTVNLLQSEFGGVKPEGCSLPVQKGTVAAAAAGDLVIEIADIADTASAEGYTLEIGSYVKVTAPCEREVMYGVRTVLQQVVEHGYMPYGKVVDYPVMNERALHIDIGRKFFTCEWIKQRIRQMSYLKLNTLQLHFSENEGFTLVSERHPEVMSERYLTKAEISEILHEAKKYHIAVIPSLDSPGHLGHALRSHPEWLLADSAGNAAKGALDITNPAAKAFVLDLIDEYAELFKDSVYFHMGGDEFIDFDKFDSYPQLAKHAQTVLGIEQGTGVDAYIGYINKIADFLEQKGFTVRAWNDGLYRSNQVQQVDPKTSIQIGYWTKWHAQMAAVQTILDKGHQVINFNDAYFYYVLGENAGYKYPTGEKIYDSWHPGLFPRISETEKQEYSQPYPKGVIGCSFAIWSDTPSAQTEEEAGAGIAEPLRAMAELSWIGEKRYESFAQLQEASREWSRRFLS